MAGIFAYGRANEALTRKRDRIRTVIHEWRVKGAKNFVVKGDSARTSLITWTNDDASVSNAH